MMDAVLYSAALTLSGDLSTGSYLSAVRIDWVGDMNGIIILLPLVLLLRAGEPGKLSEMRAHIGLLALQAAALLCIFWFTFRSAWPSTGSENQTALYLLLLPIIWIALRWGAGVTAVALAVLQLGIVTLVAKYNTPESFLAIQVLMVLLAATGLYYGNIRIRECALRRPDALHKNILLGDVYIAPVTQQFAGLGNIFIMPDQGAVKSVYNANNPGSLTMTNALGSTTFPRHEGDPGSIERYWPRGRRRAHRSRLQQPVSGCRAGGAVRRRQACPVRSQGSGAAEPGLSAGQALRLRLDAYRWRDRE